VQDPTHRGGDQLACASRSFGTRYGEKVGDYFFAPLRKYTFTERGVKRWYAPRLVARQHEGMGFAAINLGEEATVHENVPIPPQRAVLVAHAFETMAARVHVTSPGTYFIAAVFSPTGFEGPYVVTVGVNGKRLCQSTITHDAQPRHGVFVRMTAPGFIDFANNADKEGQTVHCRTFVQYAVVRCDDATGALELRCDDRASDLEVREIVALHAQTAFVCVELSAPHVDLAERIAMFEQEWTLPQEYISSQYQCSVRELVELVMSNRKAASSKYCIFMMPRSGSTLLTELLASSGKLGFPGESFVPDVLRTFSLTFSDRFSSYEQFLLSGFHSENGVFGTEIEFERFVEEAAFFADLTAWRHVYIWREDLLAQAISLRIASETWVWHTFEGATHDETVPFISRASIVDEVNFLLRGERFFRELFAERGIAPYSLSYEQLVADPEGQARRIAEHVGVESEGLSFFRKGKAKLQPTAKARNAYYKQIAICAEGELWGYDIHQRGDRYLAVLHGVDIALLDTVADRAPVLFVSESRDELCDRVHQYAVRYIASLSSAGQGSVQPQPVSRGKRVIEAIARRIGYSVGEHSPRPVEQSE
jgi:LPS sulfotransferase NodH